VSDGASARNLAAPSARRHDSVWQQFWLMLAGTHPVTRGLKVAVVDRQVSSWMPDEHSCSILLHPSRTMHPSKPVEHDCTALPAGTRTRMSWCVFISLAAEAVGRAVAAERAAGRARQYLTAKILNHVTFQKANRHVTLHRRSCPGTKTPLSGPPDVRDSTAPCKSYSITTPMRTVISSCAAEAVG